jgi:cobalt/nickel transport protein
MTTIKKLWVGIGVLALLSPLGLILPSFFKGDGAWGEWSLEKIERMTGFAPQGMKRLSGSWKAPLPDYTVPGQRSGMVGEGLGYLVTAIIGIALAAGITYLLTRLLVRRNGPDK